VFSIEDRRSIPETASALRGDIAWTFAGVWAILALSPDPATPAGLAGRIDDNASAWPKLIDDTSNIGDCSDAITRKLAQSD
jgi:hypothetical protein